MGALCSAGQVTKQVMLVGLDNAGKTSVLYRLILKNYDQFVPEPTIGFNYEQIAVLDDVIGIWDLGGKDTIRSLWPQFYKNIQFGALVFMVDLKDSGRYQEVKNELYKLMNEEELRRCVLCLLINRRNSEMDIKSQQEIDDLTMEVENSLGIDFLSKNITKRTFVVDAVLQDLDTFKTLQAMKKWLLDQMDKE